MGHVEVAHLSHALPDGRVLLDDVSFRVGEGAIAALVGPNGAGKTTLLRLIAGDLTPQAGTVSRSGGLGVMRQFIGGVGRVSPRDEHDIETIRDTRTVYDLLVSIAPPRLSQAAHQLEQVEQAMRERDDESAQLRYARALADWGDAGGYDAEVLWDACCVAALGTPYEKARRRDIATLSGGEQKRLVLEALSRGPEEVLLLDEPDNYLDVPSKIWLEERLRGTRKTVLLVSHDRELLANTAQRVVTVDSGMVWVHGGGFATYARARRDRIERLEELRRRWDEEHARLKALVQMFKQKASYNSGMASRYQAAQTRLRRFEEAGPPELPPRDSDVRMRLRGGRTGKRAVICADLALTGLLDAFSTEIWFGERVAVLGSNGSGKSHFLRLLAGLSGQATGSRDAADRPWPDPATAEGDGGTHVGPVAYTGIARLGARVVPGHFVQTHARPDLAGRSPVEIVMTGRALLRNEAMAALARYELQFCADQPFETLSGGQQARLQILLLELSGCTLLLLDEPTDNLDLASAQALQEGLESYEGTVLAVTHDRWFAKSFDRFLVFGADGAVHETDEPVWDAHPVG